MHAKQVDRSHKICSFPLCVCVLRVPRNALNRHKAEKAAAAGESGIKEIQTEAYRSQEEKEQQLRVVEQHSIYDSITAFVMHFYTNLSGNLL